MKIKRTVAVAFLVACGFQKAADWDNDKVTKYLAQAPEKLTEEDMPEEHLKTYQEIKAADGQIELIAEPKSTEGEGGEEKPKEKKTAKTPKPAKETKPAKTEPGADKPESKKAPKETKPAKTPTKEVEKDAYGCRKGTISAKVNKALSAKWKTEEEIAEEAGVTLEQARGRLYYAEEDGVIEREKLIRYRVKSKEKTTTTEESEE